MKKLIIGLWVGVLLAVVPAAYGVTRYFDDVDPDDWFYEATANMNEMGVLKGYKDGTFQPNKYVNRAELAVVMDRFDKKRVEDLTKELIIQRTLAIEELQGSDWDTYARAAWQYPVLESIPPSYNKMGIDWSKIDYSDESKFEELAKDKKKYQTPGLIVYKDIDKISLVPKGEEQSSNFWGVFFIRHYYDGGSTMHGPFYGGHIDQLVKEINASNQG